MAAFPWHWTEKEHSRWATTRLRGMLRYIVYKGLLRWGVIMFLVMACGPAFFGVPYHADLSAYYWLRQILIWAAAGLGYGLVTWCVYERMDQNYLNSAP